MGFRARGRLSPASPFQATVLNFTDAELREEAIKLRMRVEP